ncbi:MULTISPECIES: DoxX family protein [Croceibacter]|mgnify:CR=1 FL=1|jgi:hypothetical protein|uniref:DoxX-like family protein n=1 Tax=Croceibacter atlanticus (strain ATCC BAA-628 / JCM 21780 / CIP 108009 / IAM 15332 / KCTC 12090 / HTCC2559) TaxID=216432 RepID=A3U5Q7_CROAH|nr:MULTISPECIES: DoxX family protein [Croceibacter]EAP87574.1 hypothetical protein CA2559_02425 [Croceibacter atlanticus HTCC2559]MBG26037.1 DoxX family protein [Croceibacter sp.]MBW4970192.1 DoxX family protein [Croceibacter atlanticus]WSP35249.1 DoxX family protein [Croceibacter atlanticus]|tara:strand:+ start:260 stop:613 length:354 start_codon:yes stop_codon:yes gene_type:complete
MRIQKIIYWVATALLCALMLYSASFYFLETDTVKGLFESYNYPTYIVIPLAIAKVLGVVMILWRRNAWLTSWAYAGFFFDIVLAFFAHQQAGEDTTTTLIALIFLLISFFFGKTVRA